MAKAKPTKLVVLSDLHLGEGVDPKTGKIPPTEDFFFDREFSNFLNYLLENHGTEHTVELVINGDMIDFLQIVNHSKTCNKNLLTGLGSRLKQKFFIDYSKHVVNYKIEKVFQGHRLFFESLADFLLKGNNLVILPGNHDIEFQTTYVKEKFRLELEKVLRERNTLDLDREVCRRIIFRPLSYIVEDVYIEHGSQYDCINSFPLILQHARVKNNAEPSFIYPVGSHLVYHVYNEVEKDYPFADNLYPQRSFFIWTIHNTPWLPWPFIILGLLLRYSMGFCTFLLNHLIKSIRYSPAFELVYLVSLTIVLLALLLSFVHETSFWDVWYLAWPTETIKSIKNVSPHEAPKRYILFRHFLNPLAFIIILCLFVRLVWFFVRIVWKIIGEIATNAHQLSVQLLCFLVICLSGLIGTLLCMIGMYLSILLSVNIVKSIFAIHTYSFISWLNLCFIILSIPFTLALSLVFYAVLDEQYYWFYRLFDKPLNPLIGALDNIWVRYVTLLWSLDNAAIKTFKVLFGWIPYVGSKIKQCKKGLAMNEKLGLIAKEIITALRQLPEGQNKYKVRHYGPFSLLGQGKNLEYSWIRKSTGVLL